jgi:hypothetical protein
MKRLIFVKIKKITDMNNNVVEFASFHLKKGVSVPDFLIVSDKFQSGFLGTQKGYISRKLLVKGEMWADLVIWETMDDVQNAMKASRKDAVAAEYLSLLKLNGKGSFCHFFNVEKSYGFGQ